MPKQMIREQIRCQNPACPSLKHGQGALACELERPPKGTVTIRWRCRRCRTPQRLSFPPITGLNG